MNRLLLSLTLLLISTVLAAQNSPIRQAQDKPNIILILTDDQDYYDLGFQGNPEVDTPNLDQLSTESLEMGRFYVSPLCSPTRASLLTGRSHQRTGILHTSRGATRLADDETTIAELLSETGYRTGIFGKWHLGDNYPSRPQDQGFEETFNHKSGGIGQPPDEDGTYWKPVVHHNGKREVHDRFCTDLFFDKAIDYMNKDDNRPYFIYLPTNVPHSPFDVDPEYYQPFVDQGIEEKTARIYGMVKNLDENVGRLLDSLDRSGKAENTLIIFMSDNGGVSRAGFQGAFRGHKGDIYEGGIRAPFIVRWPAGIRSTEKIDTIAAHYDLLPTLAAVAGADLPPSLELDGKNLLPLWQTGDGNYLEQRTLFVQFVKSIEQALYKCATAIRQDYKLIINPDSAFDSGFVADRSKNHLELYDIRKDAGESANLSTPKPEIVEELLSSYESWYESVKGSRNMLPGRIFLDPQKENPVHLSRYQEGYHWHHDSLPEGWMLDVKKAGTYRIHFTDSKKYPFSLELFWQRNRSATLIVKWKEALRAIPVTIGDAFVDIPLEAGEGRFDIYFVLGADDTMKKDWNCDITIEYLSYKNL